MSIILQTEKKNIGTRIIYLGMYLLLAIGSISMIYPFLLMVSGSLKSRIDENEFNIIPKFVHDDKMLFQKQVESKYNEDLQLFLQSNKQHLFSFRNIELPKEHKPALVMDWEEFIKDPNMPISWFVIGYGPTTDGKIIQRNERAFREYMREICKDDLDEYTRKFNEPLQSWFFLKFQSERLLDRTYLLQRSAFMETFYGFKSELATEDRIYVSADAAYSRYLRQTSQAAEPLTEEIKTEKLEYWVRNVLHPQFIKFDETGKSHWTDFLKTKYEEVKNLNKLYNTAYKAFDEVVLPIDRVYASPQITDFMLFITNKEMAPTKFIKLDTPVLRWRNFLEKKYGSTEAAARAHGRPYKKITDIETAQFEYDHTMMIKQKSEIKNNFLTRNFTMVFEYILLYGKGLSNTLIYCALSIILALLVNPIAAYAMSRYQLRSQFKILLFLISTMTFPAVVTMIPNFLLLRDLGLLNTFAALLLPTMANGYSIFLLKGFFDSLPKELYEAADIDGASEWNKFWMITMNLSKPILAVIALGAFNGAYSNFMFAFILCQDPDMWTLMVWLYQLQQFSSQGVVFASLLIAAIPTLLIFIFCQNLIIKGIVVPTEK
ncbi:MAG: carbohydrate ABC transporter permease [Lentisphaeria bacterium]|nr:carbohydrate ABC transporter permease [Lentisphaeria bacterium]